MSAPRVPSGGGEGQHERICVLPPDHEGDCFPMSALPKGKAKPLGDGRAVYVDEARLAALFWIAHQSLSCLEGSEATEQAVDQNLVTADALRADLIKWIATAQTALPSPESSPLASTTPPEVAPSPEPKPWAHLLDAEMEQESDSYLGVYDGLLVSAEAVEGVVSARVEAAEGNWRESDIVKFARKTLSDYEGPRYAPLPERQWAMLLSGVLAERDFIGEWLQRMFDEAAGAESVHDAYDKGWSEAEAHFASTTAGEEWDRAELWRSKANDMDSRLKLAMAFVENAGPVVGNRAELLQILSGASTTSAERSPESSPSLVSATTKAGQRLQQAGQWGPSVDLGGEQGQLFLSTDLADLGGLLDWLGVIEDGDTEPWAGALGRVIDLALRLNEVLPGELAYRDALELSVLRNLTSTMRPVAAPRSSPSELVRADATGETEPVSLGGGSLPDTATQDDESKGSEDASASVAEEDHL